MLLHPTSDSTTSPQIHPTSHEGVRNWVTEMVNLCQPEQLHWCDGSEEEKEQLTLQAVEKGILIKLNQKKLPGCYYHAPIPTTSRALEECTFICTRTPDESRSDQPLEGAGGHV